MALSGPFAGVCRALWISAWNLGLVRDRTDQALVSFVKRQTGIDHLNWLPDPMDARKAIESLKDWIAREAGVEWDQSAAELRAARISKTRWRKLAVIAAQQKILGISEQVSGTDAELDEVMKALGRAIRAVQAPTKDRARQAS